MSDQLVRPASQVTVGWASCDWPSGTLGQASCEGSFLTQVVLNQHLCWACQVSGYATFGNCST